MTIKEYENELEQKRAAQEHITQTALSARKTALAQGAADAYHEALRVLRQVDGYEEEAS
jgi:hypothetical protein